MPSMKTSGAARVLTEITLLTSTFDTLLPGPPDPSDKTNNFVKKI